MSDTMASLRRKIDSAADLQSVVRAMRALAASSIGRYEQSVLALSHYVRSVEQGLGVCFRADQAGHSQVAVGPSSAKGSVGAVVFGSDQGLVGRFNEVVVDFAMETLARRRGQPQLWAVGERVHDRLADAGVPLVSGFAVPSSVETIAPLVGELLVQTEPRPGGLAISELHLFYNRPTSSSIYAPVTQRLLPLDDRWRRDLAAAPWPTASLPELLGGGTATLRALIREHLFISLFRACAESLASENASRLAAMQRAEENIEDLLESLGGRSHRLRQATIDEELFDVIAAATALER